MARKIIFLSEEGFNACFSYVEKCLRLFGDEYLVERKHRLDDGCKRADAVLFFGENADSIASFMGLYARRTTVAGISVFYDTGNKKGAYSVSRGTLGREVSETITYAEMEVERVARICFEYAEKDVRRVIFADDAGCSQTGKLWRYAVHDVLQDYPDVFLTDASIEETVFSFFNKNCNERIVLTNRFIGGIISQAISLLNNGCLRMEALLGETNVSAFGTEEKFCNDNAVRSIVETMLAEAFERPDQAKTIETQCYNL